MSRPARGAWIETRIEDIGYHNCFCRAPHGARGLKLSTSTALQIAIAVAPRTGRVD